MNADLNEELRDHIDRQIEENLARGMGKEEARLAASRSFGNLISLREQTHETWAWAPVERLCQDFLYAGRSLRRAPLLSAVAIIALSLGIGLNTGVFTILNALFLKPPTLEDPHSFVQLFRGTPTGSHERINFLPSRVRTLTQSGVTPALLMSPPRGNFAYALNKEMNPSPRRR